MANGEKDWRERFWGRICKFYSMLLGGFALTFAIFALSVFLLPFVEPGTGSHAILLADVTVLGVTLIGLAIVIYGCRRHSKRN